MKRAKAGEGRRAAVFVRERKAGELAETSRGYTFTYDPAYLSEPASQPISFSLPLRQEPYQSPELFSFFEGLLPEGWLLAVISRTAHIDEEDRFGLLLQVGRDPVGAVSVQAPEEAVGA